MTTYQLTESVRVGPADAPSRVVFGPHETNLADGRVIGARHAAYYARRARGGTGIIITETASVTDNDWPYERAPLASECPRGWSAVRAACRPYGTLVLAGLGHAGAQGSSAYSQEVMWAPSRVADVVSREPPAELDQAGIDSIVSAFARAARLAVAAGLDGLEIDAGAWSVIRQFHSGLTNTRGDEYGSDRLLFTRQILAAVRKAVGTDHLLALRLSCDELAPWAGVTPEHAAEQVAALAEEVDLLTVVRAGPFSTGAYRPDSHTPPSFNRDLCAQMRSAAGGRTLVVLQGSVVDPGDAQESLASGVCDLVEMTRALIADARLVSLVRAGQTEKVRPCLLCNQACHVRDNRNPIVSCVMDPTSGYETTVRDPDSAERGGGGTSSGPPVLIVGAGPAGLECCRILAGAGRRVRVLDRAEHAGGAVPVAASGAGRERLRLATEWLEAECRRAGAELTFGVSVDEETLVTARSDGWEVVLATGSRPLTGRYPDTGSTPVIDAYSALAEGTGAWAPGPVVVYDPVGDQVAISLAERLAAEGRAVTLISPDPVAGTLLSRTGDLADANVRLQRAGVTRQLRSRIRHVKDGRTVVEDAWTGATTDIDTAVFVDAGHRLPEESLYQAGTMRIGDCVAPRTILEAVLEGRRAALAILGAVPAGASH